MNRLFQFLLLVALGLLLAHAAHADTFQMADGSSITGEIMDKDEGGLRLKLGEGSYTDRIPWTKFSQADLKRLQRDPKMDPLVAPFIEIPQAERIQRQGVGELKPVDRLPRPATKSLLGSLFLSPLGWLLVLLLYGANLYSGFEVAVFRGQPRGLVCGVSALLPVLGPIIFLSLPVRVEQVAAPHQAPAEEIPAINPMQADLPHGQHSSLHIHLEPAEAPGEAGSVATYPAPEVFTRGQFTFNRRFFETRFPKFFGVYHGGDKDKVLVVKSLRKQYITDRIVRVTPADIVLQVTHGAASEEVTLPFNDVTEVILKHKDAP